MNKSSRENKIDRIRKKTKENLIEKLDKHRKCALIRPTGFGKTWTLTELINKYKRVLYVYPSAAILNTVVDVYYNYRDSENNAITDPETIELAKQLKTFDRVDMMTYMKLQSLSKADIKDMPDYDLIVFDEAHIMGACKAKIAIKHMFNRFTDAHIVGATATPNRMDGFDFVDEFFNNIVVFQYTLHDAFQDNLLQRPNYYYCTYNINQVINNARKDANTQLFDAGVDKKTIKDKKIQDLIRSSILHASSILNMDRIIKHALTKYSTDNYFKFICFFGDINKIDEQGEQVKGWFQKAFPDYTINTMNIHSRTSEALDNVNQLNNLTHKDNHIDLIFCVNMVNVGYHVNDLTGILMYRGTQSNIIYIQQLGRALSSGSEKPCFVFDVVDNLHRKALYEMKTSRFKSKRKVTNVTQEILDSLTEEQKVKYDNKDLRCRIEDWNDKGYGYVVLANDERFNATTGEIITIWWDHTNNVEPEDLVANGTEATYKELIAKVVAEPMSYLCREAVNLHFKRWCRDNNIPYPITNKELKEMYGISEEEWREDFKKILERGGLDYPWQDAQKIMDCATVPFEIFAKQKRVSVPRILQLLGVA